jgi:hypothetical protein
MKKHSLHRYTSLNHLVIILVLFTCPFTVLAQQPGKSPVKVFILAGQSNMQGHGTVSGGAGTLENLLENDAQGIYSYLGDKNGNWTVRDDVWITYERSASSIRSGGLTAGYGENNSKLGPELGFGHVMGDALDKQVLLIKTCWGGKSLAVDFRPPSSGGAVGFYYEEMFRLVNKALANLATYFPNYDGQGYELAGVFWHQGWNDRVNQGFNDEYEVNMANFIRDVRKDLGIPSLPFVIATTGMSGWEETHPRALSLMEAQLAVAEYPEFQGTVVTVDTRPFFRPASESPSGQAYHWNSNGITYVNIGLASGEAMKELIRPKGSGSILRQWWSELDGASLADLSSHADYPNHPDGSDELTRFQTPADWADNYGTRIQGYLYAPIPGEYTFWLTSDQEAELWLSTDANAASASLIAATSTAQRSSPIQLKAGIRYYIEALHSAGQGPDQLAVSWEGPNVSRMLIEGQYLSPWTGAGPPALTILNNEPQGLGMTAVTLGGEIITIGSESPQVLLFWGETDGSITRENWEHVEDLGTQSNGFAIDVSSLKPLTTYYFRTFCSNSDGHDWADMSAEFSTLSTVATVEHLEPTNLRSSSLTLNGRVSYLGAEAPVVTLYWGTQDGQTNAEAWGNSQPLGIQSDLFSVDLSGLTHSRTYYYRFHCANAFGESWADASSEFKLTNRR